MKDFLDTLTASMLADLTGGTLQGNSEAIILRARADSRICRRGDLFVALHGENLNGRTFAASAWSNGAEVVLASKGSKILDPPPSKALVLVEDAYRALLGVAAERRNAAEDIRVVGITGSNGKTTTKNILSSIMMAYAGDGVLSSPGNYNSDIGLPLVLFDLRSKHRCAVFEMGMNHAGEMRRINELVRPSVGVVTNIGMAHIGNMGSLKAIAQEKREIFRLADSESIAIVGDDEPWKEFLLKGFPGTIRCFGKWGEKGWKSFENKGHQGFKIKYMNSAICFPLAGEHNLRNAMAAVEVAVALGVSEWDIKAGLESAKAATGRCEIIDGPIMILNDSYNANPESLIESLKLFNNLDVNGRRIVVLGEMLELGSESFPALQKSGKAIATLNPDTIFLFGDSLSVIEKVLLDENYKGDIISCTGKEKLKKEISLYIRTGDAVLLKGSRANALEELIDVLKT